ncbi:restriction endonuclease subunit S [uncultured Caulobacter sp.]|uniref:restriction endonuclease subunit S n=1 Tax=uncultured Caulobacter sp. TaxID=158749 RepID=UPI00260D1CA9|nr:restriction endonuclease subunit S [uncultured Caulobacter sp.]
MSRSFTRIAFSEALEDLTGGNIKTLQSDYLDSGDYPIVDQGKALVAGYTNDASRLCQSPLPLIIFGDHTRIFKYVDFPFGLGADGTKVLRAKAGVDPKYVFHFLQQVPIESAGYSRHFKFLKETTIPLPPLDEQRRIAAILDQADALRRKRREHSSRMAALVSAKFQAMFGDPVGTKRLYPSVELVSLIDSDRPITYGILKPGPDLLDGVPYVRVVDIKGGRVLTDQLRRTSPEISHQYRRSTLRTGDVLISIRGHVGRMALVPPEADGANITQDTARLAIVGANPIFVRALMEHPLSKRWMAERTRGIAVQGINLGDLKKFPVLVPPREEQDSFADFYKEVELNRSAGDRQLAHLDALFASLQHRAFRGEL